MKDRRQLFRPNRIIPFLTILGAGIAITLPLFTTITLTAAEGIIIALLGLLAIDALTERMSVLEKIENKLSNLSTNQVLQPRSQMISVEEQSANASEIAVVAISGVSLGYRHVNFFEKKVKEGCKIRIILLDPDSPAVPTWKIQSTTNTIESDIKSTRDIFKPLLQMGKLKGKFEIRLTEIFAPFSMFAVDLNRETGSMVVEYHVYKKHMGERPHVFLTPADDSQWYNFYKQQFEQIWSEAEPWPRSQQQ